MRRGEIWLVDLGYVAKVRPVLVMSVPPGDNDRALVSYVTRTTSLRGTNYEVEHRQRGMKDGAFDAQGIATTDQRHFLRRLGSVEETTMERVEDAVRAWLAL